MTTTTTRFEVHPIPAEVLESVRGNGIDAGGNPVVHLVADGSVQPLRCCLRYAHPGENIILFGYEPPLPPSPYREVGAVFAHAETCPGPDPADRTRYPAEFRGKRQVFRAYDARGWITDAVDHDGSAPESVIAYLFTNPAIEQVHIRNIGHGCLMFTITRSTS